MSTKIEWTDETWNPITGCTKVSPGCDHCYAKTMHERFNGPGSFDTVTLHPARLDQPLRWKKPRKVFVNSMSDLFHDDIPDAYIGTVFEIMARAEQHTFQVLTKRHGRMRSLLNRWAAQGLEEDGGYLHGGRPLGTIRHTSPLWTPPPNVWLGVSVENQQWADIRIPALLDTPAAVRFLSCEPLLGPVNLIQSAGFDVNTGNGIGWVIVGGESGHGARPMHPDWARSLRDQCTAAGVPFLFKQWGEWAPAGYSDGTHLLQTTGQLVTRESGTVKNPYGHGSGVQDLVDRGHLGWVRVRRTGKTAAGRVLDNRKWDEYPQAVSS